MKLSTKLIFILGSVLALSVSIAHAQSVDATINNFGARSGQLYAYIDAPLYLSCMSNNTGAGRFAPVIFTNSADYKLFKELLQLAYVQKKRVKIYATACYLADPGNSNLQYPIVSGIDMLTN